MNKKIIELPNAVQWESSLPYTDQSEETKAFADDLGNYDKKDFSIKNDGTKQYKEWAISLGEYEIVRQKIWIKNKVQPDAVFIKRKLDHWHFPERVLRVFLSDSAVSKGIASDEQFKAVVDYALHPPEAIVIPKVRVGSGWFIYLNTIGDSHRAILNAQGIDIVKQNEEKA